MENPVLAKCVLISVFFIQCFCAGDAKKCPCLSRSGGSSPQRFTLREMFAKERKWKDAAIGSKKPSDQAEKESKGKEIARKNTLADLIKKDERNEEQRHSVKEIEGTSTLSEMIEMETNEEQKHPANTPKAGDNRGKAVITAEMESVDLVDGEQRGMEGKAQAGKRTLSQLLEEEEQNQVQTYSADMPKADDSRGKSATAPEMTSSDHLIAEEQKGTSGGKHTLLELLGIDPNQVQTYSADMPKAYDTRGKSTKAHSSDQQIAEEQKEMLGGKRTL